MLSSSEFNNAVPQFTNGNYANNPIDPSFIEEPSMSDYNRGVEPLETLPAQWWNWLCNQFTSRFNKLNLYIKNIFDELTQLFSLVNVTPDGTESSVTTGQLKNIFKELYPAYVSDKLELGTTYVPQTRQVNGHALTSNITVTKGDVGLGNVVNTGDSATPVSGGTTKFTTGGAYTELNKKQDKTLDTALDINGTNVTTVESALANLNNATYLTKLYASTGSSVAYRKITIDFSMGLTYNVKTFNITSRQGNDDIFVCLGGNGGGSSDWAVSATAFGLTVSPYVSAKISLRFSYTTASVTLYIKMPAWRSFNITQIAGIKGGISNESSTEEEFNSGTEIDVVGINDKADLTDLAPSFSTATAYAVGDYVIYNGNLYRCTVAHSAGAWNSSHFTDVTVGGELEAKANQTDLAVPSDAVLHYSFDDVPDYPDGTAVYKHIKDFPTTSEWAVTSGGGNATYSVDNGIAVWTTTNNSQVEISKVISDIAGKLLKIKFRFSTSGKEFRVIGRVGETLTRLATYYTNGEWQEVTLPLPSNIGTILILSVTSDEINSKLEISSIYIGDGSYTTPIIDNANGQNNAVNNGGIAVQGVCGKGVRFFKESWTYLTTNIELDTEFSLSLWVAYTSTNKPTQSNLVNYNSPSGGTTGFRIGCDNPTKLSFYSASTSWNVIIPSIVVNKLYHVTMTYNNSTIKFYIDGSLVSTITGTLTHTDAKLLIGGVDFSANYTSDSIIDDFLIFNRALSAEEVQALYLNKANTPKFAESLDVPTNNVQTPFSAGGAFDFFGGNTKASSWLNKVFGYALCRDWKTVNTTVGNMFYLNDFFIDSHARWSTDGLNWTQGTVQGDDNPSFVDVKYANGIYVSCGYSSESDNYTGLQWSTDGKNWTQATGTHPTEENEYFTRIEHANGLWVVTGGSSEHNGMYWSTDGKAWTLGTVPNNIRLFSVIYANNIWVATSWAFGIFYSTDGKVWTQASGAPTTDAWFGDITYANGTFVTGCWSFRGYASKGTWWSDDGINWTQCTGIGTSYYTDGIYYARGIWLCRKSSRGIAISTDGKSWKNTNITSGVASRFCYANGLFVCTVGEEHTSGGTTTILDRIYVATDPNNWFMTNLAETSVLDDVISDILYAKNKWLVSGDVLRYSDYSVLVENGFFTD